MPDSFEETFCAQYGVPPELYGTTVLRLTLYPHARWLAGVLVLQAFTGVATIYFNFPLTIAVVHNAGAAALVLLLTMVNYRAKYLAVPYKND